MEENNKQKQVTFLKHGNYGDADRNVLDDCLVQSYDNDKIYKR